MNIFKTIKTLWLKPAAGWQVISVETTTISRVFISLVFPLLLIGGAAIFIGYGLVGFDSFILKIRGINWGLWFGLRYILSGSLVFFIASFVVDAFAPVFNSEKNLVKSAQLVAWSSTVSWAAAIFLIYPMLGFIGVIGLYGVYLFYSGLPFLKKTPENKRILYMLVSALIIIIFSWLVQIAIGSLLNLFFGDPYAGSVEELRNLAGIYPQGWKTIVNLLLKLQ